MVKQWLVYRKRPKMLLLGVFKMKKVISGLVVGLAAVMMIAGTSFAGWGGGCWDCEPAPAFDQHGFDVANPMAARNPADNTFSGDNGSLSFSYSGGGYAGGVAEVEINSYDYHYAKAEGSGTVDEVVGGKFKINNRNLKVVGVGSYQHSESEVSGYAVGGSYDAEGRWCPDTKPEIRTDMTVEGIAFNNWNAGIDVGTQAQWANVSAGGWNEAGYFGQDFEENDHLLFWELNSGSNSLEGSADVAGGSLIFTKRFGTSDDIDNTVIAGGLTAGGGTADVVEVNPFLCWTVNSNPDDGERNYAKGSGGVAAQAFTTNPTGSTAYGYFNASYQYSNVNTDQVYGGGIAGGYTKVTVGNGTAHVISESFSKSTGGSVQPN
jgi:hypothetical protein